MPIFGGGTSSGGSSGHSIQVLVNFGAVGSASTKATTTVTGQTWVTANSYVECQLVYTATVDHTADDLLRDEITASATNFVPGVGFDVVAISKNTTIGHYLVACSGI